MLALANGDLGDTTNRFGTIFGSILDIGDGTGSPTATLNKSDAGVATFRLENAGTLHGSLQLDPSEAMRLTTEDRSSGADPSNIVIQAGSWTNAAAGTQEGGSIAITTGDSEAALLQ